MSGDEKQVVSTSASRSQRSEQRAVWTAGEGIAPQAGEAPLANAGDDSEPRDPQLDAYDKQRAITLESGDFASWTALISVAERLVSRLIAVPITPRRSLVPGRLPLSRTILCRKPAEHHAASAAWKLTILFVCRTTRRG